MAALRTTLPLLLLLPAALAVPAPTARIVPDAVRPRSPAITPPPALVARNPDFAEQMGSYVNSVISGFGSGVSSFVASGVPQYYQGFPTGQAVERSAGVAESDLTAKPTQVLNVPAYANWTNDGWNVRVRGNVYKQPDIPQQKIDDLANNFLIDVDIKDLPPDQQAQARNVTRQIYVVQQGDQNVTVDFVPDASVQSETGGGIVNAQGGAQTVTLPDRTTDQGDFDIFVPLRNTTGPAGGHLQPGNEANAIQALNMYVPGTDTGNATAYLVPPRGLTVISDIDDILRVTKIYLPKEGLLNSFARPFTPWLNMPSVYANWSASLPATTHFHYLTTTPEQVTRTYMDFIYRTYPPGSFDTRPLNFSDVAATLRIRRYLLDRIFRTFPERRFVLVGDTTNSDVMKAYPDLFRDYPGQVACILLRNTSATDAESRFPYDTSGFRDIPQNNYMFFTVPDDLARLDVAGGRCWNETVKQNVTFGYQGLPFGNAAGLVRVPAAWTLVAGLVVALLAWI